MSLKFKQVWIPVFLSISFLLIFCNNSYAEVSADYALKINLESHLENRLKQVITEITGSDKMVILVNTELASETGNRGKIEKKKSESLLLPGVPVKKEFGAGQPEPPEMLLPVSSGTRFTLKRISLSVWIDQSIPDSVANLISDISKDVIGYNQHRGDQITIKKVDFGRKPFYWSSFFSPPGLFWLILCLLGGFLVVTVSIFFMDPFKKLIPAVKSIDWTKFRGTASPDSTERPLFRTENLFPTPEKSGKERNQTDVILPFSFIKERDLASLAFLLKEVPSRDAAIVTNYLEPALAIKLMELFPKEKQAEIALHLGQEEINIEKVSSLEETIKGNLTYVIGGEAKIIPILELASEDVRNKVLKSMESGDPESAMRLRQRIKDFETIIRELPAQAIQVLYRQLDPAVFAPVLKSSPDDVREKVVSSLSAGAAERLRQEIDLARPLSDIRFMREKQNIVSAVRRMVSEGILEVENN